MAMTARLAAANPTMETYPLLRLPHPALARHRRSQGGLPQEPSSSPQWTHVTRSPVLGNQVPPPEGHVTQNSALETEFRPLWVMTCESPELRNQFPPVGHDMQVLLYAYMYGR